MALEQKEVMPPASDPEAKSGVTVRRPCWDPGGMAAAAGRGVSVRLGARFEGRVERGSWPIGGRGGGGGRGVQIRKGLGVGDLEGAARVAGTDDRQLGSFEQQQGIHLWF